MSQDIMRNGKYKALPITKSQSGKIAKKEAPAGAPQKKKSYLNVKVSAIGCKLKRLQILDRQMHEKKRLKTKQRRARQEHNRATGEKALAPMTTDDKREVNEDFVFEEDEELLKDEEMDEFAKYFREEVTPKILMTTGGRVHKQTYDFMKEIRDTFPNCHYWPRKDHSLKKICEEAPKRDYTHVIVWRENRRRISDMILIYLPAGPSAVFKVTTTKLNKDIYHHGNVTDHYPEMILNNFNTRVGRRVARLLSTLCPQRPEFKGRRVVTFHNQRDFIFFRHHRYIFKDDGERVALQEIGPRFTLKLQSLQHGTWDNQFGELEFKSRDDMYVSRKKTYL